MKTPPHLPPRMTVAIEKAEEEVIEVRAAKTTLHS
jgi:hypothetical protein